MKENLGRIIIELGVLLLVCELIYWILLDFVLFNEITLDSGLGFLYYSMAAFIAFTISSIMVLMFKRIPRVGINLLFTLANVYSAVSLLHIFSDFCEEDKNIPLSYSILVVSLIVLTYILLALKILPKMTLLDIAIVIITTTLFLVDALLFLIGYNLFYPGFW